MRHLVIILLLTLLVSPGFSQSQVDSPYHINGSAFKENCNCYTLTTNDQFRNGSVWNINKIDLRQSFDYTFDINLGCNDAGGADGMVFVLQPVSTNIGSVGGGIGFEGIRPSIGVVIDTWKNDNNNDPSFDHISINRDGDIGHSSLNNLAGPVTALASSDNIEDCQWHTLRISWNPGPNILSASIDGVERVFSIIDLVAQVFNNDPLVYWGFSAATGGSINHQRFCTSLNAQFNILPSAETCAPYTAAFRQNFRSFGTITERHWDFGDGSFSTLPDPPPHLYDKPGIYTVRTTIRGNDGCWSDTFRQVITVGSIPDPGISSVDTICGNLPLLLTDQSTVAFGTINKWEWTIDGSSFSGQSPPPQSFTGKDRVDVTLSVATKEGCVSPTFEKTVDLLPIPDISLPPASEHCLGDTLQLFVSDNDNGNRVLNWTWNPAPLNQGNSQYVFSASTAGNFTIAVYGSGENGCNSDTLAHTANFVEAIAKAGRDTIAAINQPIQLQANGGPQFRWSPSRGLNDPDIANPVAILDREITYTLTAYSSAGCEATDSLTIRVYKGPELYMPNAFSPNGDGRNDRYKFVAVGMKTIHHFRIYNRLGQIVYSSTTGDGWDGNFHGAKQPPGNFTWSIAGTDYNDHPYMKKGSLLLVR